MTPERNKAFEKALYFGVGPDTFVWGMSESKLKKMSPYALDAVHAKEAKVESLRVSRDPLPCCGVRADMHDKFGCGR